MSHGLTALAAVLVAAGCDLLISAEGIRGDATITCHDGACMCVEGRGDCSERPGEEEVCETDLQRDPRHCGACGHSCLEGRCVEGVCQPFTFYFSENTFADYLGIAGDRLYIPSMDHLVTGVMLGGDLLSLITASGPFGTGAFVSGDRLFVAGVYYPDWVIFETSASPLMTLPDVERPRFSLNKVFSVPSETNVSWNVFGATARYIYTVDYSAEMLFRLPRGGSFAGEPLTYDCRAATIFDDRLLWTDEEVVFELRDDQADPVAIASLDGLSPMSGIAADQRSVYYTVFRGEGEHGSMEVWEIARESGQKQKITEVETDRHYSPMAMDERYLYAVVQGNGEDRLIRLERAAPSAGYRVLATSERINRIYVTDKLLYWGNLRDFLGVEIQSLVKPID